MLDKLTMYNFWIDGHLNNRLGIDREKLTTSSPVKTILPSVLCANSSSLCA